MRYLICGFLAVALVGCGRGGGAAPVATRPIASGEWETSQVDGENAQLMRFTTGGGEIRLFIEGAEPQVGRDRILAWVHRAADAVVLVYGKYSVRQVSIMVHSGGRGRVEGGRAFNGRRIDVHVGSATTDQDLRDDWIMTHEMFHLGFPDLGERYLWMNEGLSDYLEPVARSRAGQISVEQVWKDWVEGFPEGLPQAGDRGLDNTHTWGRTYWGGTIFWLTADLRIRKQTGGKKSLDDALKAILDAGGDGSQTWSAQQVIDLGDHATGTQVLRQLHDEMGGKPDPIDLATFWKQLGVRYAKGHVTFDDSAPLAGIRRAITAPPG